MPQRARIHTSTQTGRLRWGDVLKQAAEIVLSYTTGVTLRQLFYRLVGLGVLPNTRTYYQSLSRASAEARRDADFPALLDRTSRIERLQSFNGARQAGEWLVSIYRHDRTAGQPYNLYLAVEKDAMSEQLEAWFGDPLGIPYVALGGFASQSLVDEIQQELIENWRRESVLIIATDMDPSGEDIARDFEQRVGNFDHVERIAVTPVQVLDYSLIENSDAEVAEKLARDPRAKTFFEKHGSLMQYELDAIDPAELERLYRQAISKWWDEAAYQQVLQQEARQRERLTKRLM